MGARLGHVHSQCAARAMRSVQHACMAAPRPTQLQRSLSHVLCAVPAYDLLTDPARAKTLWEAPGEGSGPAGQGGCAGVACLC